MSGNAQKTPFLDSIVRVVGEGAQSLNEQLGRAPPASILEIVGETNTIVKVKVEVQDSYNWPAITCPVAGPEYVRYPLKVGDKGILVPSDYYTGGVSGLGSGTARLTRQANLATSVFVPIGNKAFQAVEDQQKIEAYGENGAILKSKDGDIKLVLDKAAGLQITWHGVPLFTVSSAGISIQFQGHGVVINSSGTFIDGKQFLPHTHTGVQSGPTNTGPVT